MTDMGTFRTTIAVEHPARRGHLHRLTDGLVDTGAEATWIPRAALESLGIAPERTERYRMADRVLLGARSLEGLNLRVDSRQKRLVSAGPIVAAVIC